MEHLKRFNENEESEFLDWKKTTSNNAYELVENILKSYELDNVESKKLHNELASEIVKTLIHAGLMK